MTNYPSNNETIKKLCEGGQIAPAEFDILFEDKNKWSDAERKIALFNIALNKIINHYHTNNYSIIDFSYIHFPSFTFKDYAINVNKPISFEQSHFHGIADFRNVKFNEKVNFRNVTFTQKADFWKAIFMNEADFREATFEDLADFNRAIFENRFILRECKFAKLKLNDAAVENPNLLNMSAYDDYIKHGKPLSKANFENKETARLIKAHLEMQNNITESNKYFALEQELYLDELLKSTSAEPNRWQTIITLFLNKYVSHFGTDWLRSLVVLIIFGYIVMIGYMAFDSIGWLLDDKDKSVIHFGFSKYFPIILSMLVGWGYMYFYTLTKDSYMIILSLLYIALAFLIADTHNLDIRAFTNYIVQISNPIGAFKDIELYKGIEFYATFVRITIAIIIYQLIVAFRNNTRRSQ